MIVHPHRFVQTIPSTMARETLPAAPGTAVLRPEVPDQLLQDASHASHGAV